MPRDPLHRWDAVPLDKVTEMVTRKVVTGDEQQLVQSYLKKGALVPRHQHDGEQMVYVLQGALRVVVGGAETTVREGEVLMIPASIPHHAEALDDTFVLSGGRVLFPQKRGKRGQVSEV